MPAAPPSGTRRATADGSACRCHVTQIEPTARFLWNALWIPCGRALRGDARALLEMLVRRAVVAIRQRRALARLALARRRAAARDAAVERSRLDLLVDEGDRRGHALLHCPRHLGLDGDREVAADVLEEGSVGLCEVERIRRKPFHRLLAGGEHLAPVFEPGRRHHVRVDEVFDRAIDGSRVLIHAVTKLEGTVVHWESYLCLLSRGKRLLTARKPRFGPRLVSEHTRLAGCYKVASSVAIEVNMWTLRRSSRYPLGQGLHLRLSASPAGRRRPGTRPPGPARRRSRPPRPRSRSR